MPRTCVSTPWSQAPGRAIFISFKWHSNSVLSAINVYAPNDPTKHPHFWSSLTDQWESLRLPNPDLLMGDFNLTEDLLDRSPAKSDHEGAINALRECRHALGVRDSWRSRFLHERAFTFTTTNHTMSRLDRMYAREDLESSISDWSHEIPGIPTDHKMVSVRLAPMRTPFVGTDRWTWPLSLLHDKGLNEAILLRGRKLSEEINDLHSEDRSSNAQTLWQSFKSNLKKLAASAARKQIPKITHRIKALRKDLTHTLQSESLDTSPSVCMDAAIIEKEIEHLEKKKYWRAYTRSQALWHLKGEKVSKYWSKVNNPRRPRDLIYRLIDPHTARLLWLGVT